MQESMGAIVDRSREHLAPSDAAILRMRRRLLSASLALGAGTALPPGLDDPDSYQSHGQQMLLGKGDCWKRGFAAMMAACYAPEPTSRAEVP